MKFVCDRCGKKYATAEDPAPGKVYKLKCKACGHLIVVRSQAGTSTALPAVVTSTSMQIPEIELSIEPDGAPTPTPTSRAAARVQEQVDDAVIMDAPLPPEVASAIDGAAPVPVSVLTPPPPDKDELADFAAAAAEVMDAPATGAPAGAYVDLFAEGASGESGVEKRGVKPDDPFVAAARASLPEGYLGSGAPDPFAPPPPAPRPPEPRRTPAATPARAAAKPAPATRSNAMPVALFGGGLVVLLVIAGVAVMRGGKKAEPPPEPVVVTRPERPAPAPAPPPEPVPAPVPEPPKAAPVPEPVPAPVPPPAAVDRRPEPKPAVRKPEPRPPPRQEPKPEPPRVAAVAPAPPPPEEKPEPRTESRDVQLPDAEVALTPEVVQKVINANRKAFASCIAASAGTGIQLDGRRVALRLTVNSNGAVTYPTLDDVTLNSTEMGQCLKSAARLMIFPKFKGDPFHVEVPLTLSAN